MTIFVMAAGQVDFEMNDGGYPLCLTEVNGRSVLEGIVGNLAELQPAHFAFALQAGDMQKFHLDDVVRLLAPDVSVVRIPQSTEGSACTALLAAARMNQDEELLIVSANELVEMDLSKPVERFREQGLDAGTVTFRSVHPRYSYVRLDAEGRVTEAAQQRPISHHATAGIFWFARTGDFVEATKRMIRKDVRLGGMFFVAPVFNEMLLRHAKIGVHEIDSKVYHPLKSRRQVRLQEDRP